MTARNHCDYSDPALRTRAERWAEQFRIAYQKRHTAQLVSIALAAAKELAEKPVDYASRPLADLLPVRTCNFLHDQFGAITFGDLDRVSYDALEAVNGLGVMQLQQIHAARREAKLDDEVSQEDQDG